MNDALMNQGRRAQAARPVLLDSPGVRVWIRIKDHPCQPVEDAKHYPFIVKSRLNLLLHDFRWMGMSYEDHDPVLDVSHPGTQGWMLKEVRKAHGQPGASTGFYCPQMEQWAVYDDNGDHLLQPLKGDAPLFASEAECLVAALEVAP
jgi:hypothetical protein